MASSTVARRRQPAEGAPAGEWAAVFGPGACRVEEVGTHQLMRRTGLTSRDIRALDPVLSASSSSCPSTITGRERAVVVNLERARAVITASEVLVPAPRDPAVAPLVRELRARLASTPTESPTPAPSPSPSPPQGAVVGIDGSVSSASHGGGEGIGKDGQVLGGDKALPFEFRALDVCLEFACKSLEHETSTLEKEAYPALDELTSKVSTLNLECARQIKSRLVDISGRVQKVRDELEHLLDDDMDMAALHLTDKLACNYQSAGQSSRFGMEKEASELEEKKGRSGGRRCRRPQPQHRRTGDPAVVLLRADRRHPQQALHPAGVRERHGGPHQHDAGRQADQLLEMGILLSTARLVLTCGITVTGFLALNIPVPLDDSPPGVFWKATGGIVGGSVALFLAALLCYKRSGILP